MKEYRQKVGIKLKQNETIVAIGIYEEEEKGRKEGERERDGEVKEKNKKTKRWIMFLNKKMTIIKFKTVKINLNLLKMIEEPRNQHFNSKITFSQKNI